MVKRAWVYVLLGLLLVAAAFAVTESGSAVESPPITRLVVSATDGRPAIILTTYQGRVARWRGEPMIILLRPGETEEQAVADFEAQRARAPRRITGGGE